MPRQRLFCLVGCLGMVGCGSNGEYNTLPPEQIEPPRVAKVAKVAKVVRSRKSKAPKVPPSVQHQFKAEVAD